MAICIKGFYSPIVFILKRENYNVYNGNTRLCDIHYFIKNKGDKNYGKGIYRFQTAVRGFNEVEYKADWQSITGQ